MKMNLITMFLKALELQEYTRVGKQDRSLRDGSTSRCGEVRGGEVDDVTKGYR